MERSGLQLLLSNSWRDMYRALHEQWSFIGGPWNVHTSMVHFVREHHFQLLPGDLRPRASAVRVNIESYRFVVIDGRVLLHYTGKHRFVAGFALQFLVEPVDTTRLQSDISPAFASVVRNRQVMPLLVNLQPADRWVRGFLCRDEIEQRVPYENRLPYAYADAGQVLASQTVDEPVLLRHVDYDEYDERTLYAALDSSEEDDGYDYDYDDDDSDGT